jgi:hypothetical protein
MQRGMMRRRMAATAIALVLGLVWAMDDPGSEGGAALSTAERDTLLTQVRVAQAELTLARDLANLRSAVAAFADVEQAAAAGYGPASDCMASERGAQGIHYANEDLFEPSVALETPQLLMYEPLADGSLRFIGVEYLVFQQAWHDAGHEERPTLLGQTFRLNETLLDEPFYLLHVWVGQFNPGGVFADWNPLVDCRHATTAAH